MALALRCLRPLPSLLHRSSFAMRRGLPQAPRGCPAPLLEGCSQCVQQMLLSRQLATKKGKNSRFFHGFAISLSIFIFFNIFICFG